MSDFKHQAAFDIFEQACDVPEAERSRFVEQACGDDADLRTEVMALLRHDASGASLGAALIESARGVLSAGGSDQPTRSDGYPERIGNYRIVRKIGEGGMGVVFEAQQESPQRRVALKVVRSGLLNPALIKRFEREAFVLGQLQHSGIAHIYESGVVEARGHEQPYFAMEYVEGQRITDFCDQHGLTVRQRLELVARVCDSVQHAHARGIIHRDLKPANILVVEQDPVSGVHSGERSRSLATLDAIGQPKVLDFGVARIIEADHAVVTMQTDVGQLVGTLAYMSPEQVEGDSTGLDGRCDVYALGVIMYLLVTHRMPLDLDRCSVAESVRKIRDEEPEPAASVDRSLRGDVDTILAKALEKDRNRRYASASDLGADIRRYLQDEPITARPVSALYQLRKFSSRNRGLVTGAAIAVLALVVGTVLSLSFAFQEQARRLEAVAARETSVSVTRFLSDLLSKADPTNQGKDVTVLQVLDGAAEDIASRFADRPAVEAELQLTIGCSYRSLGEYDKAEGHILRAVELYDQTNGPSDLQTLAAEKEYGIVLYFKGQLNEAADHLTEILARYREVLPAEAPELTPIMGDVAFMRMALGDHAGANALFQETLAIVEQSKSPDDPEVFELKANMAQLHGRMGQYASAIELYKDVIERSSAVQGLDHPHTILFKANLASVYMAVDELDSAIPLLRQAYEAQCRVLGDTHSQTIITLCNLASTLSRSGVHGEPEQLLQEALQRVRDASGDDAPATVNLILALARVYAHAGRYDEAEPYFREAVRLNEKVKGPDAESTFWAHYDLINFERRRGHYEAVVELAEAAVDRALEAHGPDHQRTKLLRVLLARGLTGLERYDEAEHLLQTLHPDSAKQAPFPVVEAYVELYDGWGRPEDAAHWRAQMSAGSP